MRASICGLPFIDLSKISEHVQKKGGQPSCLPQVIFTLDLLGIPRQSSIHGSLSSVLYPMVGLPIIALDSSYLLIHQDLPVLSQDWGKISGTAPSMGGLLWSIIRVPAPQES